MFDGALCAEGFSQVFTPADVRCQMLAEAVYLQQQHHRYSNQPCQRWPVITALLHLLSFWTTG